MARSTAAFLTSSWAAGFIPRLPTLSMKKASSAAETDPDLSESMSEKSVRHPRPVAR